MRIDYGLGYRVYFIQRWSRAGRFYLPAGTSARRIGILQLLVR